jgi:DNA-binding NarL/FixJ family response regulator
MQMLTDTRLRIDWPTMMIVAFDDRSAAGLSRVLDAAMFKVVREPSLAHATENMMQSMPHVIVVGDNAKSSSGHAAFSERAAAIGAEIVVVTDSQPPEDVRLHLCRAADRALARRAG